MKIKVTVNKKSLRSLGIQKGNTYQVEYTHKNGYAVRLPGGAVVYVGRGECKVV